ncbi:hypothetical protein PAPHI01_1316 [Pancytospora philotis]|nr:hypothetical protein PAPHI01_1316 [Pancytospora philotis]
MNIAASLALAAALVQSSPSVSSFAVDLTQKYALEHTQTARMHEALFENCLRVNADRDESLKLVHSGYDFNDGKRLLKQKRSFIKLVLLSEQDPTTLIDKMLATHPYRTMEALHDILFSAKLNNVRGLLQEADYNAPASCILGKLLRANAAEPKLDSTRNYLCDKIMHGTSAPWCDYMRHEEAQGMQRWIEPIDAFLYLLLRVASHGADFDAELKGILGTVLATADEGFLAERFVTDFMNKVLLMHNSDKQHVEHCMRLLFGTLAAVQNATALKIACMDAFSVGAKYSIMEYIRYSHEADISGYFAINVAYPDSCHSGRSKKEADGKYEALFGFFFNEVQIAKGHPRVKELLQDDALMHRLPGSFYYRVFGDVWKNEAEHGPQTSGMALSLLARLPGIKFDAVRELAASDNNNSLLELLHHKCSIAHRSIMALVQQQNPLV